jgi:hypothetical protein
VVIIGHVNLYRFFDGGSLYLAKREDEVAPVVIASATDMVNIGRSHLFSVGWRYFENYPELAERIRNREYRNTSADVRAIVHEYNARASQR